MARFQGSVRGGGGEVTRLGNQRLTVKANGWDVGILVNAFVDENGNDTLCLFVSGGSNSTGESAIVEKVATVKYVGGDVRIEFPGNMIEIASSMWGEGKIDV
jgi:hypothetical protein